MPQHISPLPASNMNEERIMTRHGPHIPANAMILGSQPSWRHEISMSFTQRRECWCWGPDQSVARWHTIIYFNPAPGSSMQFNTIKCIEPRVGGSRQRWQRPGWARNAFRILHNILFPVKSFKIAARSFRVPWLVGSSHYSPITTLPYHYNTFLAGHIWPVPVSETGAGVSIKKVHWVWERERG